MGVDTYDIVVVGGGTAGAFSAATAATEGFDVVILERKPEDEAGHIACGDAIKGKSGLPDVMDIDYLREESFQNRQIRRAIFENPIDGSKLEVDFDTPSTVLDRRRYGEVILEEVERLGADVHFGTVVKDVIQRDGRVRGVEAVRDGDAVSYEAEVTVDAAGALSILQDKADFSNSSFDTNVNYSQFCSAYREIVEVPNEVDWSDALVFKPNQELGYIWYFPRSGTEINAGLGFQMNKPSMELVDILKQDLDSRSEFDGATVKDKLGASLPTRRPYDSAIADGFVATGDSAGHVNPTTGGGIVAAAKSAVWATRHAIAAIEEGDVTEAAMWEYNHDVMSNFGARFAAADLYNIAAGAHEVEELTNIVSRIPGQHLVDALGSGSSSMGLWTKFRLLVQTFGHWDTLLELSKVQQKATELRNHYRSYPRSPSEFDRWKRNRDAILEEVYSVTGADSKY